MIRPRARRSDGGTARRACASRSGALDQHVARERDPLPRHRRVEHELRVVVREAAGRLDPGHARRREPDGTRPSGCGPPRARCGVRGRRGCGAADRCGSDRDGAPDRTRAERAARMRGSPWAGAEADRDVHGITGEVGVTRRRFHLRRRCRDGRARRPGGAAPANCRRSSRGRSRRSVRRPTRLATEIPRRLIQAPERVGDLSRYAAPSFVSVRPRGSALEELAAEVDLEGAHLPADGRGRNAELGRGVREAEMAAGSLEDAERWQRRQMTEARRRHRRDRRRAYDKTQISRAPSAATALTESTVAVACWPPC